MNPRSVVLAAVTTAVVLVATIGGSSPAAHPDGRIGAVDLLSSAHPSVAVPTVVDRAYEGRGWLRGTDVSADAAAITSATCDGCAGESTTLQVVYAGRARLARLDNVATAWAQGCVRCTGTALSVQVVVLRGRPTTVPDNRALSVTAACEGCRTSALAFQVVLVADDAEPMGAGELAGLRSWFDEQAAVLRAWVGPAEPQPPSPTPEPTQTTEPTPPTDPSPTQQPTPTASPATPSPADPAAPGTSSRRARRDAVSALADLERLLTGALDAEAVAADVDLSR
ncbi:hypothetical protein ASC64_00765 [Nocardioides sp. Root122]|uniref:hypothetical protein n=1 Tax=Nocardioides TaxID=1839 RepID=UPI000703274C|nr:MULTISPECIES: hypothetical protein [Nocardioides]KQV77416.1 hypothetical protein ASC64_00765 [Nocardioides sp. Root122]MCK9824596.1 hypothetical protein [Nocardioides cavernae]